HRFYNVDVAPSGKMSYDESFRDEKSGSIGVNFNRRNWPGNPDAGFYKPHSELWVCPPGICPKDAEPAVRAVAAPACRTSLTLTLGKIKGRRITGANVTYAGRTVKAKKNRKTGRWTARLNLTKVKASRFRVRQRIRTAGGRTVTRTVTITRCPTAKKKPAATKKKASTTKQAPAKKKQT
ncbi:MAG: hypothetical protein QOI64_141, partial [Solirubrobacteraceae bacterium]|nr:hypothetical protein [Solirubrobacteraceae bacterium]